MYRPVPDLDPKGDVFKTLGPTNLKMYPRSLGKLTAAVVFVDFVEYKGTADTTILAEKMTAGNKTKKWFKEQSFGKVDMVFDYPTEWRTMPKPANSYESRTTKGHRKYIADALNLFPEIDFTQYHFVIIVPANKKRDGVGTSCFATHPDHGAKTKYGNVNLAVTFGDCSFDHLTYYTLIHELGHCMGLPDTYDIRVKGLKHREVAGAWDLMCDVGNGTNFLGFHRHKLEWLDNDRKHFMTEKSLEVTLSPFTEHKGLSMIVVPVDDSKNPSKAFVIEAALPIRESGKELYQEKLYGSGILVYSVDAKIATGRRPLVVYPKSTDYSKVYSYTYKAPFLVGDTFEHKDAPMKVKVLEKNGNNYKIKIEVTSTN